MSRYIDIDDVANAIYHHFPSVRTMADARGVIEEAPTIDIVRCGECKWFDSKGHCMRLTAEYGTYEDVKTDDFCSYGERKDNE